MNEGTDVRIGEAEWKAAIASELRRVTLMAVEGVVATVASISDVCSMQRANRTHLSVRIVRTSTNWAIQKGPFKNSSTYRSR